MSSIDDERMADLESLYREHHKFVWRSLFHFGLRGEEVTDALQEVFLVAHRRLSDFDGRSAPRNWLYGIARRVASDHRKKGERRHKRLHLVPDPETTETGATADTRLTAADLVERFLELLDEDKRQVFVLTELEGLTAPEISDVLGVKLNTVYSRLRAARLRFQQEIDRQEALGAEGEKHGAAKRTGA